MFGVGGGPRGGVREFGCWYRVMSAVINLERYPACTTPFYVPASPVLVLDEQLKTCGRSKHRCSNSTSRAAPGCVAVVHLD